MSDLNLEDLHGFTPANNILDSLDYTIGKKGLEALSLNIGDIIFYEELPGKGVTKKFIVDYYSTAIIKCPSIRVLFETVVPDLVFIDEKAGHRILEFLKTLNVKKEKKRPLLPDHLKKVVRGCTNEEEIHNLCISSDIKDSAVAYWKSVTD